MCRVEFGAVTFQLSADGEVSFLLYERVEGTNVGLYMYAGMLNAKVKCRAVPNVGLYVSRCRSDVGWCPRNVVCLMSS